MRVGLRSLWRQLTRGLRVLAHRSAREQDVTDEVEHYLEQAMAAHVGRGLSPEQARRAAHQEIGGVTTLREQVRGYGWENSVETLFADLRYAARRLRSEPGFATVALITLAVGIGGTTAIFSAVNPILFEPLPYPDAGRIAAIWEARVDGGRNDGSFGMYQGLATRSRSFDALAVLRTWQPTMTGAEEPQRLEGQRVSWRYFAVLGVSPIAGRDFRESDDRLDGPNVVMISDGLWRRRFGADRGIIGRELALDGNRYVVIGVMPPDFDNVLAPRAELWAPLQYDLSQGRAWGHHLRMIGRLRSNTGFQQTERELELLGRAVLDDRRPPTYGADLRFTVTPLQGDLTRAAKPALLAILGAMLLVLAIACVNVTNLLLARGARRRGEFALRAALGAPRGRLVRQLLTESLFISALAGIAGMGVAMLGIRVIVALSPTDLPRAGAIELDGSVFLFGLAITTLIGLAFGIVPARQAARSDQHRALQLDSRRATGSRSAPGALVVAEVAIALVLLVSSGLLLRSMQRLFAVDAGFDASHVLTMQIQASGQRFADDATTRRFFRDALEAVRRVPGIESAALTTVLPLTSDMDLYGVQFESDAQRDGEDLSAFRYGVSGPYVETMRIPLKRGRLFDARDRDGAPLVGLLNESYAARKFPGIDPVGRRFRIGPVSELVTIVGIVGDVKQTSLAVHRADAVYLPASQWPFADRVMSLVVRAPANVEHLVPAIRAAVWSVDKDQAVVRVATMNDLLTASAAERRFVLILFEAFALAALVLATAGIYGVLAGSVAERTREIGVRSALGATRGEILALIMRQGLGLTGLGVALGLVGAIAASEWIAAMLFGVSRLDPVTYVGVIALLTAASLLASGVPAWRAARVDPARTLREE